MKKAAGVLILALVLLIPSLSVTVGSAPARAPRSGDYPVNYEIQDYEPSSDEQWDLDVAQDASGKFYSVWVDNRDRKLEIRYSKSLNGTSWGDGEMNNNDIIVSDAPGVDEQLSHPSITVTPIGQLFCIWVDDRTGSPQIRLSSSNNSGNTWTSSIEVPGISGGISEPYIRYSSRVGLSIVFVKERTREGGSELQKDIMFTRSTDGGNTFSAPIVINDDNTDSDQIHPRMSVAPGGKLGIVWEDLRNAGSGSSTNSDIYMDVTNDGVNFFGNVQIGTDENGNRQERPDLAFSSQGDMMIVWQEIGLDGWRIRYSMAWTGSPSWDGVVDMDHPAVAENISRLDQFYPRVGYGGASFCIAWTELDVRDFYLIRAGYISKEGELVSGDHIVDDSIDWGKYINDPIYHAEMFKQTVAVLGSTTKAQVFWLDYRTDPNPSNTINEDSDPYTAQARRDPKIPMPPTKLQLRLDMKTWNSVGLKWDPSPDTEFRGYYLTYGIGTADTPDENLNDAAILDRTRSRIIFEDLRPNTEYEFRLMVKDRLGIEAFSTPLRVTTNPNQAPIFQFIEPDGISDTADKEYTIVWTCSDKEDKAIYTLHYDNDLDPAGQVLLFTGDTDENGGENSLVWNTSALAPGGYTINATIDDGVNEPQIIYSKAVIINHPGEVEIHPRVVSVLVDGGRDKAFVDATLTITFNRNMRPSTLNGDTTYVLDNDKKRVSGIISIIDSRQVIWKPTSKLDFGTSYTLVITPLALDIENNTLDGSGVGVASSFQLEFTTLSDAGKPGIRGWGPQGSDAALWPEIWVEFDIPMAGETLSPENVELRTQEGAIVPVDIEYSTSELKLRLSVKRPLTQLSTYAVNLSSSISSSRGSTIDTFEWSFATGEPSLDIDTDSDGVPDDLDWFPLDPNESVDTDGDGNGDRRDDDDDNDGMPDDWELDYGFDPKDPSDADEDADGDGKKNLDEYLDGTDPTEDDDESLTFEMALFIMIAVAIAVIVLLVIFAIAQRRRYDQQRMERSFFREGEKEE
jgi:hypothetical protein